MLTKFLARVVVSAGLMAIAIGPATRPAVAAPATVTFTVNSVLDQIDDNAGDGNCHTASGTCTLRAAVMEADKNDTGATIGVPAGIYTLTIPASGFDLADNGDLNLTVPASGDPLISIVGAGAASTIIDANQIDRVLEVDPFRTAAVSGVTLRGGRRAGGGGGIFNDGTLTVTHSTLTGNQGHKDYDL